MNRKALTPYPLQQNSLCRNCTDPPRLSPGKSHPGATNQSPEEKEGPPDQWHQDPSRKYRRVQRVRFRRDPTNHVTLNLVILRPPSYATIYHTSRTDHYHRRRILHEAVPPPFRSDQTTVIRRNHPQSIRAPIQQPSNGWLRHLLLS